MCNVSFCHFQINKMYCFPSLKHLFSRTIELIYTNKRRSYYLVTHRLQYKVIIKDIFKDRNEYSLKTDKLKNY